MKRCLIITHMNYPENRGITQLIGKLNSKGYHPYIISYPAKSKDSQIIDRCRLLPFFKATNSLLKKCFPWCCWWNPLLFFYFLLRFLQIKPSFIYVREPAFFFYPVILSKFFNIPLFLDIRENPNVYFVKGVGLRTFQRIVSGPVFIRRWLFTVLIRTVDHVSCVSEALLLLVKKEYSVNHNSLSVLANYPSSQFMEKAGKNIKKRFIKKEHQLKLIHIGGITADRGLQDILKSMAEAKKRGVDCHLTILGNGNYLSTLIEKAKEADLEMNIEFLSPVEPLEIPEILNRHAIGICSNHINENSKVTIPGKLFEYMAAGLPVLSNSRPTVAKIINEAACGFVYKSNDPAVIADELQKIWVNFELLAQNGENGYRFLKEKIKKEQFQIPKTAKQLTNH